MTTKRMGVALAAAALLLTAACGGEESDSATASADPSVAAETSAGAEATAQSPSAEPSATSSAKSSAEPGDGSTVDPKAFGRRIVRAQLEAGTVHMEGSFGPAATMTGVVSFAGTKPAMDMTLSGAQVGGGGVHMILVDGVMYLQVPGTAMGEKFLAVDSKDMGKNPMAKSLQSMDLSSSFKALKAITALERAGQETVAGVPTVHYEATVDTAESLRAQGIDPSQAGPLPPEIAYDVWVGEDDLIRKMVLGPEAGSVELAMTRWGEPVRITAPPPAMVQQMPAR